MEEGRLDSPISVEEAILRVLRETNPLSIENCSIESTETLLGSILAKDVIATENFPPFPASIMDGYAVRAPLQPGVYTVQEAIHAGTTPLGSLQETNVSYITTGAMVPAGANAVVKVEDTVKIDSKTVQINVTVEVGSHIREIGSDIREGEVMLQAGERIGPAEIGLLATVGLPIVSCYTKPVIGVLSTGNELVNAWETPTGSQIRDTNRPALIGAFRDDNYAVIDLGIVCDSKELLRAKLLEATADLKCDVIISSGGVSMGAADFVKPLLAEIGTIHFSKLNMKPGKPTTFATYQSAERQALFFGLPGNPVSCLVTKTLFVEPAMKRLQGLRSDACLHPQMHVCVEDAIKLDMERVEYHRAILQVKGDNKGVYAKSTGMQRSSRLLSMKAAGALLVLPQGTADKTMVKAGEKVVAILTGPLPFANMNQSVHRSAALLDYPAEPTTLTNTAAVAKPGMNFDDMNENSILPKVALIIFPVEKLTVYVGLLTISDRAFNGVYEDKSGPEMAKLLQSMSDDSAWPLNLIIKHTAVVPDEPDSIRDCVVQWSDNGESMVDVILTSGGTGFGLRDNTPEVIKPLLHREAPGVAQALLNEGLKYTPLAVLSRPVVGTRNNSLICTLPGSVKAVRENIVCLKTLLPRIMELLKTGDCSN